jgi:perosamine synthetase
VSTSFEPGSAPEGFIPLSVPEIAGNAQQYLNQCIDSNWVSTAGPFVDRFEQSVAEASQAKYAIATVNGTAALHIALLLSNVRPNDEVLMPALTFIASANAVRYVGAWPLFIDSEELYGQLDAVKLARFLEAQCEFRSGKVTNRKTGREIRAILPVHILGHPVDLDPIIEIANRYQLPIIEDAAEAIGTKYLGRPVGNHGRIGCFSFNGNKLLTCGGGGMIVTDDSDLARRAKYLTTQAKDDPLEYVHGEVGYNYRLTNLQAALGLSQMELLADYVEKKRTIAKRYETAFQDIAEIQMMREASWAYSTYWMYTIRVPNDSRPLLRYLASRQIQSRPLWQPLHRSPAMVGCQSDSIEVADRLYQQSLSLPCSVGLASSDQDRVIEAVRTFFNS